MNRDEASNLATRISQTWPRGLNTSVWEDEMQHLDAGRAGTAIERLRRTEQHPPSIARFWAEYRAVNTTDGSNRPQIADCDECQNTGTAPVTGTVRCADGTDIVIDVGVGPCRCPRGRDTEDMLRGIVAGNDAELDRLFPNRHQQREGRAA